jgi:hypothetical protein
MTPSVLIGFPTHGMRQTLTSVRALSDNLVVCLYQDLRQIITFARPAVSLRNSSVRGNILSARLAAARSCTALTDKVIV